LRRGFLAKSEKVAGGIDVFKFAINARLGFAKRFLSDLSGLLVRDREVVGSNPIALINRINKLWLPKGSHFILCARQGALT
jgi:hypothetical protein